MYSLKILLVPKILLEWRNYLRIMDIMASSYDHFYFPPSSYLLSSLGRFLWLSEKDKLKQLFFLLFKIDVILYYYGLKTNAKQYGTFLAFLNHFQLKYLVSINSIYKVNSCWMKRLSLFGGSYHLRSSKFILESMTTSIWNTNIK